MATRKIFVNIPVRDLKKSQAFFTQLGFQFNPAFSDENAACMVLSDDGYVMLLAEPYFQTFTTRKIADSKTSTEALICISADSRAEVEKLVKGALELGGKKAKDPQDHGFMFGWSFYDLDDHHWEVMWMDPSAVPPQ